MIFYKKTTQGFTLIELLVTISLIALLSSIIYASFDDARKQSRDKVRKADLKELQLAVELYKAQNNQYPNAGCGATVGEFAGPGGGTIPSGFKINCNIYIDGLVPDFIPKLPTDPNSELALDKGFYYRSDGNSYKIMVLGSVEADMVTQGNEFGRCPTTAGACSTFPSDTYAVYSMGAENW